MSNVLLISEDFVLTNQILSSFDSMGWVAENVTLISMIGQGSELMKDKSCGILVVDAGFSRYSSLVLEMSAVIRNCSMHAPLYLIFKGEYDRIFDAWSKHAKRTFQSAVHPLRATQAIEEIIRLETSSVPRETYYSPMDSI
ncbi:MAG TPA: hypothetical protein VIO39_02480 [Methylotenera sp.]